MQGFTKLFLFWFIFLGSRLYCQVLKNDAFFIAPNDADISFFKINLKPSQPDVRTDIFLRERQVFMSPDPNSQALALLGDISIETTGDSIYRNVGTGVCINPRTPVNANLLRYNPGGTVVLLLAKNNYTDPDWERAKKFFEKNKAKLPSDKYYDITIVWEIPPGDTLNSLTIPVIIQSASERIVLKTLISEEMSRFKHDPKNSLIRLEVLKRFGAERNKSLYFVQWEAGPIQSNIRYDFRVVFRVW
jgi:hypothetical protein